MDKYEALLKRAKWRGLSVQEHIDYARLYKGLADKMLSLQELREYEELLARIEKSVLSSQELAMVATELQKDEPEAFRHTLLLILYNAQAKKYRELVEQYLRDEEDNLLASLALETLCGWGYTEQYRDEVLQSMGGAPWDAEGNVRIKAISIAGNYLRSHTQSEFLSELLRIFDDADEAKRWRQWAYCALARAMGRNYNEIPGAARDFDLETEIDPNVVQEARERLTQETRST